MFGSVILEVAAGLTLIYLVLSAVCTAIRESLEAWMRMRSTTLERTLREMLQDPDGTGLTRQLFEHPLIYGLFRGDYDPDKLSPNAGKPRRMPWNSSLPSYIPKASFAAALMDLALPGSDDRKAGLDELKAAIEKIDSEPVKRVLYSALMQTDGNLTSIREFLESWYDSTMERASGWYRRWTQLIVFLLGLGLSVLLNVDTLHVAERLYNDSSQRQTLLAQTEALKLQVGQQDTQVSALLDGLKRTGLPIGWTCSDFKGRSWSEIAARLIVALPGWLLTAFAISLGAPFWFDILNRVSAIRTSVKPKNDSSDEKKP